MPGLLRTSGSRCLNRPDCSVEVVEATVMKSWRRGRRARARSANAAAIQRRSRQSANGAPWQFSFEECGRLAASAGAVKKRSAGVRSASAPLVEEQDLVGQRGAPGRGCAWSSRSRCRRRGSRRSRARPRRAARGIEARGRLVEEEHARAQRPGAREREALLLAARQHARRAARRGARGPRARAPRARARCALGAARRRSRRARSRRWRAPSGAASPGAGTPSPAARRAGRSRPRRRARGGREQAVQRAQQHALARAVGAEDHDARARRRASRSTPSSTVRPPRRTREAARLAAGSTSRSAMAPARSIRGSRRRRR